MDYNLLIDNIKKQMKEYTKKAKLKSLVLGISGGIDSAVVAVLARMVCDELGIRLIGISIPIETNTVAEIERANMVGNSYCHKFMETDLTDIYQLLRDRLFENLGKNLIDSYKPIAGGNLKARTRMGDIYLVAGATNGMVLSTDNFTEYLLSFWTSHGDVGDYCPIQMLWKSEIYDMVPILADLMSALNLDPRPLNKCRNGMPTDGLGISNNDLDQIMPDWKDRHNNHIDAYREVDEILKAWHCTNEDSFIWDEHLLYEGRPDDYNEFVEYRKTLTNHPVVLRHISSEFKRKVPINISRIELTECMDKFDMLGYYNNEV